MRFACHQIRRQRRATAGVEVPANRRAPVRRVRPEKLQDVRTIGGQTAEHIQRALRIPEQLVDVPGAVGVAALPEDLATLLLRRGR